MDKLKDSTLRALEQVICDSEDIRECKITQDTEKEILLIEAPDIPLKTQMNCRMNSVGATLRQICSHINKRTLFSYEPNYTIGC